MDNRAIGVYDSGVGGLNVLKSLKTNFPQEDFLYFGDNQNMPYGEKTSETLVSVVSRNIEKHFGDKIKLLVIACNTLSQTVIEPLQKTLSVRMVGVFPPFDEPYFKRKSKTERTAVLCTALTAEKLKKKNCNTKVTYFIPNNLASVIEKNIFDLNKISLFEHFSDSFDHFFKFENLMLSCTHYLFLKEKLKDLLNAENVYDGILETVKNVGNLLEKYRLQGENIQSVKFIGENAKKNESVFSLCI